MNFRDFAIETMLATWGNPNAPALTGGSEHTSQPATEPAASGASELRGSCDCCGKRPYKYTGVFYGIETAYCWECAGETAEEQDE